MKNLYIYTNSKPLKDCIIEQIYFDFLISINVNQSKISDEDKKDSILIIDINYNEFNKIDLTGFIGTILVLDRFFYSDEEYKNFNAIIHKNNLNELLQDIAGGINKSSIYLDKELYKRKNPETKEELKEKHNLTKREDEILDLIVKGYNNAEISGKIYITTGSVKML
jgi:hypothetical protein